MDLPSALSSSTSKNLPSFNLKLTNPLFCFRIIPQGFSSLFLQMFFLHCIILLLFSGVFIVDYICLRHYFLRFFHFINFFSSASFHQLCDCFFLLRFLFCFKMSATDLRKIFILSGVFYLTLLLDIWHNLLSSRLPRDWQFTLLITNLFFFFFFFDAFIICWAVESFQ